MMMMMVEKKCSVSLTSCCCCGPALGNNEFVITYNTLSFSLLYYVGIYIYIVKLFFACIEIDFFLLMWNF